MTNNIVDLTAYRERLKSAEEVDSTLLFEETIDDVVRDLTKFMVHLGMDLDVDITHESFAVYCSSAAGYYKKALRVAYGLEEYESKLDDPDATIWQLIEDINNNKDEDE
jgi:hypothetical protein|tara:strand:- start:266 stop:592 length:327 start_codon:yes stop_codon:yes gene_type:complete